MRVQWRGDNLTEIDRLLSHHHATAHIQDGQRLLIRGIDGLKIEIEIGDTLILKGDSLGVESHETGAEEEEITWTGENLREIAKFVLNHDVNVNAIGDGLALKCSGEKTVYLKRGDKLLIRQGRYLCVSRSGKDHRA